MDKIFSLFVSECNSVLSEVINRPLMINLLKEDGSGKTAFQWIVCIRKAGKGMLRHENKWNEKYDGKKCPLIYLPYLEYSEGTNRTLVPFQPVVNGYLKVDNLHSEILFMYALGLLFQTNNIFSNPTSCIGLITIPVEKLIREGYSTAIPLDWLRANLRTDSCDILEPECKDILKPEAMPLVKELLQSTFVSSSQSSK